jgi:hypothetical protein
MPDRLPTIYLTAFPLGIGSGAVSGSTRGGDVMGEALAEDGTGLGGHLSSSVAFARHDMGLTSDWKHNIYAAHYPSGYRLEWVEDAATHGGWQAALVLNRAKVCRGSSIARRGMTHPDFDQWSGEPPDPRESGPGQYYRCLDCDWAGRSALAYDHHCKHRDHRIILRDAPDFGPVAFGCCPRLAQPTSE